METAVESKWGSFLRLRPVPAHIDLRLFTKSYAGWVATAGSIDFRERIIAASMAGQTAHRAEDELYGRS